MANGPSNPIIEEMDFDGGNTDAVVDWLRRRGALVHKVTARDEISVSYHPVVSSLAYADYRVKMLIRPNTHITVRLDGIEATPLDF
jgi:hypothetical protein